MFVRLADRGHQADEQGPYYRNGFRKSRILPLLFRNKYETYTEIIYRGHVVLARVLVPYHHLCISVSYIRTVPYRTVPYGQSPEVWFVVPYRTVRPDRMIDPCLLMTSGTCHGRLRWSGTRQLGMTTRMRASLISARDSRPRLARNPTRPAEI